MIKKPRAKLEILDWKKALKHIGKLNLSAIISPSSYQARTYSLNSH